MELMCYHTYDYNILNGTVQVAVAKGTIPNRISYTQNMNEFKKKIIEVENMSDINEW